MCPLHSSYTVIFMTQIEVPQRQKLRTASNNKKNEAPLFKTQAKKHLNILQPCDCLHVPPDRNLNGNFRG